MGVRAEAARETGERILAVARQQFAENAYDDVSLDGVAAGAGVTAQTVLRRFGSKEELVRAIVVAAAPAVEAQREEARAGDVAGAVATLVEHYEAMGDEVMNLIRQERRVSAFAEITAHGRDFHARWVERVFEPWLSARVGVDRRRLKAQLIAACDVYTWFLLRRQAALSRAQTSKAMVEMIEGVLP